MSSTRKASRIRRVISSVGLLPAVFKAWRTVRDWSPEQVARNRSARAANKSGIPIPPGSLLLVTGGTRDVSWYLESGTLTSRAFKEALERIGRPITSFRSVLDFGCGVGRVLRQWIGISGPAFHGSDYNPELVAWTRANLPF